MSGEPVGAEDKNPEIKVTPEMVEAGIAALEEYLLDGELIRGLRPEAVRNVYMVMLQASKA
jgi:hypothetical protein